MCLHAKNDKINKATRKITVFKLVRFVRKGHYESEFKQFRYIDGFEYYNDNFPKFNEKNTQYNGEGIHCFKSMTTVAWAIRDTFYVGCGVALECYIPKGARYIRGKHGDVLTSSLVIVGPISNNRAKKIRQDGKREKARQLSLV